jgi:hypothetical protein
VTSSEVKATLEVCEKCRRIRLVVFVMLVISMVLAGYLWGKYEHKFISAAAWGALACAVVGLLLILAVEIVVTKVELEAKKLTLHVNERNEEVRLLREKNRDLERSLDLMAKDDENVRERLRDLAIHQAVETDEK